VIKSREAARKPDLARRSGEAEAIFLAGGDQWNYVRMWKGTTIEDAINRAYRRRIPAGGSSAGHRGARRIFVSLRCGE
jgi:cyanophycinase-like exopeptidase